MLNEIKTKVYNIAGDIVTKQISLFRKLNGCKKRFKTTMKKLKIDPSGAKFCPERPPT